MSKHTPGPWAFGSFHRLLVVPVIDGQPCKHDAIADLGETEFPFNKTDESARRYADAALIAAAPELLEALKGALEHWPVPSSICKDRPAYEAARAAIKKAGGEV